MQSYWKDVRQPADEAFGYFKVAKPMFIVIICLSAVEVPGLDLIIARVVPWEPARWIALAVGVIGLLWMIVYAASFARKPHLVGPAGLRIRLGGTVDITVPWDNVASISKRARSLHGTKSVIVVDGCLHIGVASQTNIALRLVRPQHFDIGKNPEDPVSEVRIYADDPDGLRLKAEQLCPNKSTPTSDAPSSPAR